VKLGDILPKIAWDGKKNQNISERGFLFQKKIVPLQAEKLICHVT